MRQRFAVAAILASFAMAAVCGSAEAFGRRSMARCCPSPCPSICYPQSCCCIYEVSAPEVPISGPFPTLVRAARVGHGVIVQVDVPTGINPAPTDLIQVIQSGPGEMKYEGYNKVLLHPVMPGAAMRYSIFLCPTKPGEDTVTVGFVYSDNTIRNVPFRFSIR